MSKDLAAGFSFWLLSILAGVAAGYSLSEALSPELGVWTDEQTGCQYMANSSGGVTPRIAADYMHMGCRGIQEVEE